MTRMSCGAEYIAQLVDLYLSAKDTVIEHGFAWEVDWQTERRFHRVNESDFLRESAWTIISTGFRESVVRRLFEPISDAFLEFHSAVAIQTRRATCRRAALRVFRHESKVDAILDIAGLIAESGFQSVHRRIEEHGIGYLETLPYIGSITAFHLAKNLGLPVVKPDRHMQRIAKAAGFESPHSLCESISAQVGDPVQVIDVVLWRFATLSSNYVASFAALSEKHPTRRGYE